MIDLQTGNEMQIAYHSGEQLIPEIAFSADSTIKIPVMVESYRRLSEPISSEYATLIEDMIVLSDNTAPDKLMSTLMSVTLGPLEVTKDHESPGIKEYFFGWNALHRCTSTATFYHHSQQQNRCFYRSRSLQSNHPSGYWASLK